MANFDIDATTATLADLVRSQDRAGVNALVADLPPADLYLVASRLDRDQGAGLLELLDPAAAAAIVMQLKDLSPHLTLEKVAPQIAAEILQELPSNEEADLISLLDPEAADRILERLPPEDGSELRALAAYPDDVAGGLMATEILDYPETSTVQAVVDDLRDNADIYADYNVQYVYVTRGERELSGVLKIRDLLLSPPTTRLGELVVQAPVTVDHMTALQELSEVFDRHRFLGLPVVADGELVGVIRRAAVEEALAERTARQFRLVQGIIGGEEVRSLPVAVRSGRRLAFLSTNIVLNVVAASVIVYFEDTLASLIALAAFLPIISDMSGCSGNQAVAVSMRELALGLVRPREVLRVLASELKVGLVNGAALGLLLGVVAWLWRGSPTLGVVVGAALAINTIVAVAIGGTVPLLLRGLGIDPALASGPILTTVTDICGFFLALGFAALALSQGLL